MNDDDQNCTLTRRSVLTGAAAVGLAAVAPSTMSAEKPSGKLQGKTAFITGGARGIGLACAEELAKDGANIVLFDIAGQLDEVPYPLASAEDLAAAKSLIENHGVKCLAISGDVRDAKALQNAAKRTIDSFETLDFLVVNAGITQPGRIGSFSEEQIRTIVDINLVGSVNTLQAALPHMQTQNAGRIILMASVTGRQGSDNFPLYGATKWAMIGLTKSTALTVAKNNITVNAICPTLVNTKLLDNKYVLNALAPGQNVTFDQFNEMAKTIHPMPVGFYEPVEIGQVVSFLCSDGARYVSGEVLDVGAAANARFPA